MLDNWLGCNERFEGDKVFIIVTAVVERPGTGSTGGLCEAAPTSSPTIHTYYSQYSEDRRAVRDSEGTVRDSEGQ